MDKVSLLALSLHQQRVGYLAGFQSGKTVMLFDPAFREDEQRPTLGLITHPHFPNSAKLLQQDWVRQQRLHPLFSNLLPEGALRAWLAQALKIHSEQEFKLFSALGLDLPGALVAEAVPLGQVPETVLKRLKLPKGDQLVALDAQPLVAKFSLAGVQMKFSMREQQGRFTLTQALSTNTHAELGDWIVKTPSTQHAFVPLNEYTGMRLAQAVGVDIPDIKLIPLTQLEHLPPLNLPQEQQAFAIKRFDRRWQDQQLKRVHMEDFAQVLVKYPYEKYQSANYQQLGQIVYQFSGNGLADVQQLARRLLVNILLANGDAHLKNWSLLYADAYTPRLAPAYDILTTCVYIQHERQFALNLAKNKDWYLADMSHFNAWAEKVGVPWRSIKPHLHDVMDKARNLWPSLLQELPMIAAHKVILQKHWQALQPDFRIS